MRVAVFVDAGYLYAGGSVALVGSLQPRYMVDLNLSQTICKLKETVKARAGNASLLRIYWYDGVPPRGASLEQQSIADADDVKLRLGIISPSGQQKGVDSLIVTDLVELARNHAISDAVLLSGDEDVRIGVQIAQSFGVRVHLIGIEPSRGNQSRTLMQEADTTTEWSKSEIGDLIALKPSSDACEVSTSGEEVLETSHSTSSILDEVIAEFVDSLRSDRLASITDLGETEPIPSDIDRRLLGRSRGAIGRDLSPSEREYLRSQFKKVARSSSGPTDR